VIAVTAASGRENAIRVPTPVRSLTNTEISSAGPLNSWFLGDAAAGVNQWRSHWHYSDHALGSQSDVP